MNFGFFGAGSSLLHLASLEPLAGALLIFVWSCVIIVIFLCLPEPPRLEAKPLIVSWLVECFCSPRALCWERFGVILDVFSCVIFVILWLRATNTCEHQCGSACTYLYIIGVVNGKLVKGGSCMVLYGNVSMIAWCYQFFVVWWLFSGIYSVVFSPG